MTTPPEFPQEQPTQTPSSLASWGTRALGLLVDYLPMLILGALTVFSDILRILFGVITFVYFYFYLGYLDGTTGQTPGKRLLGTRVVNQEGNIIGAGAGIGRKFAHLVDSLVCLIGWFLPLFDEKRQTIADKMLNTYVVEGVEKKSFSVDLYLP